MDLLDILAVLSDIYDITQERFMLTSDLVPFIALLLFLGGIVFWFMILFGVVLGVARGIIRLTRSAREIIIGRETRAAN